MIQSTQLRSHLNVDEISLTSDDFSLCKKFLPGCPTKTGLFIYFSLGFFYDYYVKKCNSADNICDRKTY